MKDLVKKMISRKKKNHTINNELLVQHNNLIEARYRLSLQEKRVILWLISQIQPEDEEFKIHSISIKEFCKILGIESKNMYQEMEKVTMRLIQRGLSIRNAEENTLVQVTWLSSAKYLYKEGIVKLCFSPYMQPYLLSLKKQFTKISLIDVMKLRSIHAVRIYEILKQYESIGERIITLSDLREYCGISKAEYSRYNDFKRYVLLAAFKEINKKTDITFEIEEIKKSRKIDHIIFRIQKNSHYQWPQEDPELYQNHRLVRDEINQKKHLAQMIIQYGFSKRSANLMIKDLNHNEIHQALKAVDIQIKKSHVRNTRALVRSALKEKWKPDIFKPKKPVL